jgi:hypothetical protein
LRSPEQQHKAKGESQKTKVESRHCRFRFEETLFLLKNEQPWTDGRLRPAPLLNPLAFREGATTAGSPVQSFRELCF